MSEQQTTENPSLIKARSEFERFETTTTPYSAESIDHIASKIRSHLANAGFDASALDASGESSAKEMESRIEQAVARAHLVSARSEFERFETTTTPYSAGSIDHIASKIRSHFKAAGTDASALDPSGQATPEQMEARIDQAAQRARDLSGGPA